MNRNPLYKLTLLLTLLILGYEQNLLFAGAVAASEKEKKEILNIGDKRRTYYQLHGNNLSYNFKGAGSLEIIVRRAVPSKLTKSKKFGYSIIIDDQEPVIVNHQEKIQKGVTSSQHPGHGYTKSGKSYFTLGKGKHSIQILHLKENSPPVLLRLLLERFKPEKGKWNFLQDDKGAELVHIKVGEKKIRYYSLSHSKNLLFHSTGPKKIEIITRLAFESWMGREMPYRLQILKNDKLMGTYFLNTEKSDQSTILEDKEIVPGKWRSIDIEVPEGENSYSLKLMDTDMKVYIRCMEYPLD